MFKSGTLNANAEAARPGWGASTPRLTTRILNWLEPITCNVTTEYAR